ncbi:class I SAM-dependent methyltransferase [Radiobacillus kanasensis]|uniref:class I SAM-dependent DNA methyltransferase n=1 Tax=Radiobacillus kanasensis TaxID=2844358 RepID=UPI001E5441F7|nr:class I SAM-dependent methyltransferase [Radiobacillus kanasensis]UFT97840.1 class I SAM-dependent methyltransferase [Radiobacillus kanasensis]
MSYQNMAKVYDVLMKDAPYEKWTELALQWMEKQSNQPCRILDLGCGTGPITRRLASHGHQLIGVDYSDEMLAQARYQAENEKLHIQWIQQDIRYLSGIKDQDLAISFCDVMNYITSAVDVATVFDQVHGSLKEGGLFIFDVHSIDHVENDLRNQIFSEVYEDVSYIWMCESGEAVGEVFHELTFFLQEEESGLYSRFDESHHQRTYSEKSYREWLKLAGFEVVSVFGDFDSQATNISSAERIFFVCKKVRKS